MIQPVVSIVIPTHNSELYIEEALASVFSQSYSSKEVIVVDDGSTDSTIDVVSRYDKSIFVLRQKNQGPATARNAGVRVAKGDYFAFLDSDDLWLRDKLLWQMNLLKQDPDLDIVFGGIENFISPECAENVQIEDDMKGFHIGTMLISREDFLSVGFLNEDLKIGEFIEWYARATDMHMKITLLDKVVMKRRRHQKNMTLNFKNDVYTAHDLNFRFR
jgi:glycosyltransferase involved in cell wall biosynthesis